ncbi:MAG TPA: HDOD domain-containing protein [Spirochaetia bacterium]|nr:HDOD domain-containing protein [Spirochaetia bacterium]
MQEAFPPTIIYAEEGEIASWSYIPHWNPIREDTILASIRKNAGFSCTIPYSNQEIEKLISTILITIFDHLKKPELGHSLVYFLKELVMNASKANSKRVYFAEKGLDITDPADYQAGLKTFKREVFSNFETFAEKHAEKGYYVRIDFKVDKDKLLIQVKNNAALCPDEEERINDRIRMAGKFQTMEEVFAYGFDETEGGGFGLIIGILMLRKVGLDENVFSINRDNGTTAVLLKIPVNLLTQEQGMMIAQEITAEIERMPQFPESVIRLNKNLQDPNADFGSVAAIIKTDPSLTTEVIRIANSPIYMLPRKVSDVLTAVKMIGLKGVKNLVLSHGVTQVFSKLYRKEKINAVMDHSYKVALYCSQIAKTKRMDPILEDIYVAALLHDFGKIITSSLQPKLVDRLNTVCREKGIPITTLEDLTEGYNHAIIGAQLAEKWNFPEKFVQAIRYHHVPLEADESFKALLSSVYLGNELFYYLQGERTFEDFNYQVLRFFSIETEEHFTRFVKKITDTLEKVPLR